MKYLNIILITFMLLSGCNSFDEDINKDPNNPSTATASQLLVNAQIALQDVSHNLSGQFLSQYLSEVEYQDASLYPVTTTSFYGWYQGPLMNLNTIITDDMGSVNEQAIAKILKAYYFWYVTDRWGDIPYMEALQGTEDLTPKYDTQEFIYNSLFALLKEAEGQIDGSGVGDDIIYGGNMAKWKKLSASIRLVMALRLSEVDESLASSEFAEAFSDGLFEGNDDNFIFNHLADENNQNYWFGQIDPEKGRGREWWALSETVTSIMKPINDPRIAVYGRTNLNDEYVGLPFGTLGTIDASQYSLLGTDLWAQDAPVYLLTNAELLFALAEGAHRGWIAGGETEAENYYNMAIEKSFLQWTGNEDASTFLAQPGVQYDAANAVEQIITQKYIHLFMNGYEAWAEWRRTGYPDNLVQPEGIAVPTRQIYTETEQFNNTENYEEAVQRQFGGNDGLYENVWWDIN